MKRIKRHKIKHEKPETSSAFTRAVEEHDLAYYIHDRVELMHQVFSVLKSKDLRAMAPESVRRLSIDDLQELCTEELLGISSKRLLAVLDGAEPPSDTESSSHSSDHIEAISLDSISSDEEILSQGTKKKHKHKRRDSKSKKHKSKKPVAPQEQPEKSKASRAGLTVLELLELQARARAIRAQLQQEHAKRSELLVSQTVESSEHSSDSDVEVKEEPAEVVEIISSDDEKPNLQTLEKAAAFTNKEPEPAASNRTSTTETAENKDSSKKKKKKDKTKKKEKGKKQKETVSSKESDKTVKESTSSKDSNKTIKDNTENNQNDSVDAVAIDANTKNNSEDNNRVTKRVNDLIITVPQHTTRKIKLNRKKVTVSIANNVENDVAVVENTRSITSVVTRPEKPDEGKKLNSVVNRPKIIENVVIQAKQTEDKNLNDANNFAGRGKNKDKVKRKQKKKTKRQSVDEDHDEITLQLSDSEKMDLLENFDKRNYDNVSSSSSDSESSSSSSSEETKEAQNMSKEVDKPQEDIKYANVDRLQDPFGNVTQQCDMIKSIEMSNNDTTENTSDNNDIISKDCFEDCKEKETNGVVKDKSVEVCKTYAEQGDIINTDEQPASINYGSANDSINKESERSEEDQNRKASEVVESKASTGNEHQNVLEITKIDDIPVQKDSSDESQNVSDTVESQDNPEKLECKEICSKDDGEDKNDKNNKDALTEKSIEEGAKASDKKLSEGELSSQENSDVEALEMQPEVVCISDDETPKKKKKKDKKAKKDKKKKSDFRESADQNFYQETKLSLKESYDQDENVKHADERELITLDDDNNIYEILELSDDSSCYEVEGATLSKEPTVEEIAALSAKIDEIEREEVVTEQEILIHEKSLEGRNKNQVESSNEEIENISWKDRYLGSKKVKKVLTTSNILNAMRKKNKELKKKMEESKKRKRELEAEKEREEAEKKKKLEREKVLEGSIEQYNTLEASTKYVDPVPDPVELAKKKEEELKEQEMKEAEVVKEKEKELEEAIKKKEKDVEEAIKAQVTGEMKKDAKQLLNMYKKLLKYNDIKKQKDPNKKKSKKKKKKEKDGLASTDAVVV